MSRLATCEIMSRSTEPATAAVVDHARKRLTFENLLSVGSMLVCIVVAFSRVQAGQDKTDMRIGYAESRIDKQEKIIAEAHDAVIAMAADMKALRMELVPTGPPRPPFRRPPENQQ